MLYNLRQVIGNQRPFSNWLLFSESLFVGDNRAWFIEHESALGLLCLGDGAITAFIKRDGSQVHVAGADDVGWAEPQLTRACLGPLREIPSSVQVTSDSALKCWSKAQALSSDSGSASSWLCSSGQAPQPPARFLVFWSKIITEPT